MHTFIIFSIGNLGLILLLIANDLNANYKSENVGMKDINLFLSLTCTDNKSAPLQPQSIFF